MKQANAIMGLLAQTSIHAGTGQNTGIIDLPIQREGHNGWPCIFGSAVKGAIRAYAEESLNPPPAKEGKSSTNPSIALVFGSEANESDSHAGAIAFGDARLLLFPVRSLTSQFKWVTCPAALRRYQHDAARLGQAIDFSIAQNEINKIHEITETTAIIDHRSRQATQDTSSQALFLEEYRFTPVTNDLTAIIDVLAALMPEGQAKDLLHEQLTIVSDDMFSYIVQHTTPVNAHIAIESATKMVKNGALWYEESLPPESLLYTTLSAAKARQKDAEQSAENMLAIITALFPTGKAWLQLGGNETVGMGWCAVTINKGINKGE